MKKRKLYLFISIIILVLAIFAAFSMEEPSEVKTVKDEVVLHISTINLTSQSYQSSISLLGEVTPQWESNVKAQLNGKVNFISPNLMEGQIVEEGETLVKIEDYQYKASLAEAEVRLSNAKIKLEAEKLSNRQLFLDAAKKEYNAAQEFLILANNELDKTHIKAPFKGLIIKRFISQGEILFSGSEIAKLYGVEKSSISVAVSTNQWNLLPNDIKATEVTLKNSENSHEWVSSSIRDGQYISQDSRLRQLIIEIENPLEQEPPLYAGTFLNVLLKGRQMENLLEIPESALTNEGLVWYVDSFKLRSFGANPLFRIDNKVYIKKPLSLSEPIQIATSPNSAYAVGMKVSIKEREEG